MPAAGSKILEDVVRLQLEKHLKKWSIIKGSSMASELHGPQALQPSDVLFSNEKSLLLCPGAKS